MADSFFDWRDLLEEVPESAYFSYQNQPGRSPNQLRHFQSQFENVQKQYKGAVGQQIRSGETPSLRLEDFLSQWFTPGGGAAQQWGSMSPGQRGAKQGGFAPPARFMF